MKNQGFSEISLLEQISELRNELAKNETMFRAISENSLAGIYIIADNVFEYVNPSLAEMFGYSYEEIIGVSPLNFVYPEDREMVTENIRRRFQGEVHSLKYEFRCLHKSGSICYVMAMGSITELNGRKVLLGNVLDISQSKTIIDNLDKLNRLYSVISQVNRTITEIRDKDRLYNEICRVAIDYGKLRMAWIGLVDNQTQTIKPFAHAGFEDGYLSVIKPISVSTSPEGMGPSGSAIREGKHFMCRDFETDPLVAPWRTEALNRGYRSSIALPIKQSGKVIGAFTLYADSPDFFDEPEVELLLEVAGDISFALDAIELEKQKLETKNRFAEIFESITDGFVAFDSQMNYTFLNKRGAALLGYQPSDLIGKNYWTEFPEAKSTPFANAYLQVLETKTPCIFDNYFAPWDRWFENRIYPTPEGIAVYFSETTERKRADKLLADTTEKLNRAQHLAKIGSWEANLVTGQVICSEEMYRIIGVTVGLDLKIEDLAGSLVPGEFDRFRTNFKKAKENNTNHKAVYRILRKDGEERYIHHEDEIQVDENDQTLKIFGTSQDITDRILAEEEILQTKKQFQAMFEHSPMGIALVETQTGKILEANLMFLRIIGRSTDEMDSLKWMEITHPEDLKIGIIQMDRLKAKEITGYKLIKRYVKPDGTIVWVNITVAAIQNEGDKTTRHLTMVEDITDQKANQDMVLVLSRAVEQSPVSIVITDTKGDIEYVNEKFTKITGYSREEAIGNNPRILKSETKSSKDYTELWNTITIGSEWHGEFLNVKKNGETYSEAATISPITDDEGKIVHFLAIKEDITEQKKITGQLKTLSAVVEQSPLMIIITSSDQKIEYANSTFTTFVQYSTQEIIGKTPWIFNQKHLHHESFNQMWEALNEGNAWQTDLTNRRKDGSIFWEQVTVFPLLDNFGSVSNYIIISSDITEKKQLLDDLIIANEKSEESNQLKTAFINNISHEIRTPLNGILGFGELISQTDITEDERLEYLGTLQQSTDRLIQTVTDYMDISKIVTGNMDVNKSDFDIRELFEELMYQTKKQCTKKDIDIKIELPQTDKILMVCSDKLLIGKAILHLLSNAVKFTQEGSITFGYRRLTDQMEFFVKDTGIGIANDKLKTIFNTYTQEDTSTTRGYEGSGLGLAIVAGIANLLEGKTWAESVKGQGAEFYLSIPCQMNNEEDKPRFRSIAQVENNPPKNRLILIAEDIETNYTFLQYLLNKSGFETLHALDGAKAVELCKLNKDICLVLMDIKMPVMDGIQATHLIKQFWAGLPIIAVTAFVQTEEENLIWEAGCVDILAKPFRKEELLFKISKYI